MAEWGANPGFTEVELDAEKLRMLADWFDVHDDNRDEDSFTLVERTVQADLRRIAKELPVLVAELRAARALTQRLRHGGPHGRRSTPCTCHMCIWMRDGLSTYDKAVADGA